MLRYRPGRAMNYLSKLPRFQVDFQKFLFKRIRKEVDDGCRLLDEPEPTAFSREDIDEFEPTGYYNSLCETFPTYMTAAVAATASGNYEENMEVCLSETAQPGFGWTRPETTIFSHITIHNVFFLSCQPPLPSTDLGGQQLICAPCSLLRHHVTCSAVTHSGQFLE